MTKMTSDKSVTLSPSSRSDLDKGWLVSLGHYKSLTKPTISFLVMISALPAYLIPLDQLPGIQEVLLLLVGVYGLSSSASVFNQVLEWQTDSKMKRTQTRSLPQGFMARWQASVFGVVLGVLGFFILYVYSSRMAAFVGVIGHVYYVVLYTLILKKWTAQNIVIGGVAGAVGPLMGAAAVGALWHPIAWILFVFIILWTPPHFWSLSLKYQNDYAVAGIPMYPVIYGEKKTRRMILVYSISLLPVVLLLFAVKLWFSGAIAFVLTCYFVHLAYQLYQRQSEELAMRLFHYSCVYTLAIFVVLTIEKLVWLWIGM